MSLVDLKKAAKNHVPKIKQYYTMKRHELIQILTMNEFPEELIIEKKKISELRKEAIEKKYPNVWSLKRAELVELLYPSPNKNNKNYNHTQKHNNPEKGES